MLGQPRRHLLQAPHILLFLPSGSVGHFLRQRLLPSRPDVRRQFGTQELVQAAVARVDQYKASHFGGIFKSKNLHNRPAQRMSLQDVRSGHLCCVQKRAQLDGQLLRISGMRRRGLIGFS